MKRIYIYILVIVAVSAKAQQLPLYSQYFNNPMLINPGFTGSTDRIEANVIHRNQWKNIPGAPVTSVMSVDGVTNDEKIGLGLVVFDDKMGLFAKRGIYTSYSYKLKLAEDQYLRPGLSFGMQDVMIDFSKANVSDASDPNMYTTTNRKASFDANFGITYNWKTLNAGVSVLQLVGNKYRFNNDTIAYYKSNQKINIFASYVVALDKSDKFHARPVLSANITPKAPFQMDVFANFDYSEMIFAGVGYRMKNAVSFNLGVKWNQSLKVSYNYDLAIGKIKGYTGGCHEILLGYSFGKPSGSSTPNEDLTNNVPVDDKRVDSLQKQVNKLKQDVAVLKGQVDNQEKGNIANQVKDDLVIQYANDYKKDDGSKADKGFYLILGQYKTLPQAMDDVKAIKDGGAEGLVLVNSVKGYFVYSNMYTDRNTAQEELKKIRWKRIDSFVLELK